MGNRSTGIRDDDRSDSIWNKIVEAAIKDNNIKDNISEHNEWWGNIFLIINVSARPAEKKEYHITVGTSVPSKDQMSVYVLLVQCSKGWNRKYDCFRSYWLYLDFCHIFYFMDKNIMLIFGIKFSSILWTSQFFCFFYFFFFNFYFYFFLFFLIFLFFFFSSSSSSLELISLSLSYSFYWILLNWSKHLT